MSFSAKWPKRTLLGLASDLTMGRFPGIGAAQNDTFPWEDNCDGTHALNLDYVIPKNFQRLVVARLTIILRAYRTYSNFTAAGTGTESNGHNHSHNHAGHSHSHNHSSHDHSIPSGVVTGPSNVTLNGANILVDFVGGGGSITATTPSTDSTSTTPTTDSTGISASHTHTVSGSTFSGVVEGAVATNVTLTFDGGPDQSGSFGGPFTTNQIELDITRLLPVTTNVLHTIALQPSGLGRIHGILRLNYYVNASIPA